MPLDADRSNLTSLSKEELVQLGAEDSEFYCRAFFPKTVRMAFADFHRDAWAKLDSEARLVNLLLFRGAGKTSHCRLYTSRNIAYAMSRTISYVGKSEGHAVRSTAWIKKNVEHNTLWRDTFGLRPGSKWQDTEFEIIVGKEEIPIWTMAFGIEGSIRGVNRDDYRPDLIVLDDVLDDENAHTQERREKINRLVYGALLESLAPKSEMPHAKMIGLNTPQNKEDFSVQALKDPDWLSAVYGCFTRETANLPLRNQESSWPERFSSEELQNEKLSASNRNMLSTFLREKECKLVSAETTSFNVSWLKKYQYVPETFVCVYSIDPVPPPSEAALKKGLLKNDFEAHCVWGAVGDKRFLLDYELMRGHEPTWTLKTFFEMHAKWSPITTLVEGVAYQRVLMWILKEGMKERRVWHPIEEVTSREAKSTRIITAINPIASAGNMYVKGEHVEFLEQYGQYPETTNDDLLDASAMCLRKLKNMFVTETGNITSKLDHNNGNYRPLRLRRAP